MCHQCISADVVRVGRVAPVGDFQQVVWHHLGCILYNKATREIHPQTYQGFDRLKKMDQDCLLQDFTRIQQEIEEERAAKGKRKGQDNDSEPTKRRPETDLKLISEAQQEEFRSICEYYDTVDIEELKQLLRKNNLKDAGGKAQLVERCALGKMLGVWPICPLCSKGTVKYASKKKSLVCSGYKQDGESVKCQFTGKSEEVERVKWLD